MRLLAAVAAILVLSGTGVEAGQPFNIRFDPNGVSLIYPVFDSGGWILTQPDAGQVNLYPGSGRITHWADEYHAQDWSRECGGTYGQRVYAGISGVVAWAGPRGPYGNTVTIFDQESGFALKYSHLSEVSVALGEYVLAGKSLVGRVGNTGNIQSSACSSNPGSHLHLALFKNVVDSAGRPISSTWADSKTGPTHYSAPFAYVPQVDLIKTPDNPAVYALYYGTRVLVSWDSFESNGWSFDKHSVLFSPLQGKTVGTGELSRTPAAHYLWPLRDHSLLKSSNSQTVYQFRDGRKSALSYEVFQCRGLRFGEVRQTSPQERDGYAPIDDVPDLGCPDRVRQALNDWAAFAQTNRSLRAPDLASYFYYPDWDGEWELRTLRFIDAAGQSVELQHCTSVSSPHERYIGFWDQASGQWSGWQRM